MPRIELKDGTKQYISKKALRKLRKPGPQWNPAANGKCVGYDDGKVFEIRPDGHRRRHDLEPAWREQLKQKAKQEKENGTDTPNPNRVSVSAGDGSKVGGSEAGV